MFENVYKSEFLKHQAEIEKNYGVKEKQLLTTDSVDGLFQANALERIDAIVKKPLYRFFWYQDMPVLYGGGALEHASYFRMNFSTQPMTGQVASGQANVGQLVRVQVEKTITRVKPFWWVIAMGWVDQLKFGQVNFDIWSLFDEGVRKHYNKLLDEVAFFGLPEVADSYGLVNNPAITSVDFDEAADGITVGTAWEDATTLELFNVLNTQIIEMIKDMEYDGRFTPNHIILPIEMFTYLAQPVVIGSPTGAAVATSALEYLEKNLASNYAGYGNGVKFFPNRYLTGAGDNSAGRIVITHFDQEVYRMPLPMDLTRGATVFNPTAMETQAPYVCFVGEPQFIYKKAIRYIDNLGE